MVKKESPAEEVPSGTAEIKPPVKRTRKKAEKAAEGLPAAVEQPQALKEARKKRAKKESPEKIAKEEAKTEIKQEKETVAKKEKTEKGEHEKEALQAEVNIGMIGHVDHGKTTLTKALTGKWTDTHSEEIKKGISIRLGYADVTFRKCLCSGGQAYTTKERCEACNEKSKALRRVSFVDAPGHETLMATMLSGAFLMDGAVLVIAANEECPQPRTVEHLLALKIGGTKKIVVAQNKVDLVTKEQALEQHKKIIAFLKEFGYEEAPVIPISASFGLNIDLLIEAIETQIPTPQRKESNTLRMFAARSFDVNRPGTKIKDMKGGVLGGSIVEGRLKINDEIEIKPGVEGKTIKTKVSSLSTEKGQISEAKQGGLIAVGTTLDPNLTKNDQMRGQIIGTIGTLPEPVFKIKVMVKEFPRLLSSDKDRLINRDLVVLNTGTNTAVGNIINLKNNEAEIVLKNPVVVWKGDSIAISKRKESGWRLIAYGTIK